MIMLKGQIEQVEKALHKVVPKQVLFEKSKVLYLKTEQSIHNLDVQRRNLGIRKTDLESQLAVCKQKNKPEIERLGNDIAEIEKVLPQYGELEEKSSIQQKESTDAEQACEDRKKAEVDKKQTENEITELKEQINKLEGIEGIAERQHTALEKATENLNKLIARGGIKEQVDKICRKEGELKGKQKKYQELLAEVGNLDNIYHATYQAFIKGQAGLLARSLEQELQEKEEASCPVCRTVFQSTVPHRFAEYIEGTPEQGDVDKAKAAFEKKDKKRQDDCIEVGNCETELKGLKENTISRLRELEPDCPGWEAVDGTSYLDDIIKAYEAKQADADAACEQAEKQCGILKKWRAECVQKEQELETYHASIDKYRTAEQKHRLQSSNLETEINTLKNNLKYPDRRTAETRKTEFEKEKREQEEKIEAAENAYNNVEKEYNSVSGALESNQRNLSDYKQAKDEAEKALLTEVKDQGFQSMEEVQRLLEQVGETESAVEDWLKSKNTELQDYQQDYNTTRERINDLMDETKDIEKVDLKQLSDIIHQLESKNKELQKKLEQCKNQYENHSSTADAVRNANRILKDTDNAWKRLESLADLAIGVNSAGGKISFDRYVMGDVFKEVLDMANQRLDIISGGRYELIHEMSADRNNAKAGLEISVLDMTTGKRRSSSSLSGGESFFVSLALALGLSDVVQNHAGGKRLDALFIDEGFGTLDNDVLDQALAVLNQLTEGNRLVGIISHVEKLKESIPQQVKIKRGERGSYLEKIVN